VGAARQECFLLRIHGAGSIHVTTKNSYGPVSANDLILVLRQPSITSFLNSLLRILVSHWLLPRFSSALLFPREVGTTSTFTHSMSFVSFVVPDDETGTLVFSSCFCAWELEEQFFQEDSHSLKYQETTKVLDSYKFLGAAADLSGKIRMVSVLQE
jgi:hypothetical protein